MAMQWFGKPGGAPYERDTPHVPTPVGQACLHCEEAIAADDDGLMVAHHDGTSARLAPMHYECHLRAFIGGVNHLRGNCLCCGGTEPPDPPWLTKRQAAIQACHIWHQRQR